MCFFAWPGLAVFAWPQAWEALAVVLGITVHAVFAWPQAWEAPPFSGPTQFLLVYC